MPRKTIVIGGGTAGLACARALALAGDEVLVRERFGHVHDRGSHSGYTRVLRHAYHEGNFYVELVRRADRLWMELERGSGRTLLERCGLLEFGPPDDPELVAAITALEQHGLAHERSDAAAARERWPFSIPDGWDVCFSPDAGYLLVQACFDTMRDAAESAGAEIRHGVRVREIKPGGARPQVLLEQGEVHPADRVVVAAGAYTQALLPGLRSADARHLVRPQRRVLFWQTPKSGQLDAARSIPVWGAFVPEGFFYGFPHNDEGVSGLKLACHTVRDVAALPGLDDEVDPETVSREPEDADREPIRDFIDRYFPMAGGPEAHAAACLYGTTATGDFLIDALPDDPRVVVVGGLSGHGFKFAPVLGELVRARLDGITEPSLERFALASHRGWR